MNFKTTFILLICLIAVAAVLFVTSGKPATQTDETAEAKKLLDWTSDSIRRVVVDGELTLEKSGDTWKIVHPEPVGNADSLAVRSLLDALTDLETGGELASTSISAQTGLSPASHTIELTDAAGDTKKLLLGNRTSTGGQMYVMLDGDAKPHLANDAVLEQIEKKAVEFRDRKLIDLSSSQLRHIRITRQGETLELQKPGDAWQIIQPASMPADASEVSDLTFALSGLRAERFFTTSEPRFELDNPVAEIELSDQAPVLPPATQPTTQPRTVAIKVGRHVDIAKKDVYALVNGNVVSLRSSILDSIDKSHLDLRDKKLLELSPDQVQVISLSDGQTTRVIQRVKQPASPIGPPAPATEPATAPATQADATAEPSTQPSTQPQRAWEIAAEPDVAVDELKVGDLLRAFNPLRVTKYLKENPATQPATRYAITLSTAADAGKALTIELTEAADHQLVGSHEGLIFEMPHSLLDVVESLLGKSGHAEQPGK